MIQPDILEILCCPETRQRLKFADPRTLEAVNQRIAAGQLQNRGGEKAEKPLTQALVREDGKWLYPIYDDIPFLLSEEALPIE